MIESQTELIAEYKKVADENYKALVKYLELINKKLDIMRSKNTKPLWPNLSDVPISRKPKIDHIQKDI